MVFKIIDTTDDKYEGVTLEYNGKVEPGTILTFNEVSINVDKVEWVSANVVKIISSNYIAVLKVIG